MMHQSPRSPSIGKRLSSAHDLGPSIFSANHRESVESHIDERSGAELANDGVVTVVAPGRVDIDVLIPVFNAESTLESALASICRQTFRNLRIVVIDDGSTDASPDVLRRMAAEDPRIHIVTTENRGIVDALNTGIEFSNAPLIARFDADDFAFPERLQVQFDYLLTHRDCIAVGCNTFFIDSAGKRTGGVTDFTERVVGDPYHLPCLEPYLLHPFLLVRRDALVAVGGYRYVFHSEDADLYWRLSRLGRLANVEAVLGEYRIHAASVSARSVINGRVSAINSQLAALSERRRRDGRPDLAFPRESLLRYQAAETLEGMLAVASSGLSAEERTFLETATAAKLMELTSYRPYSMTRDDLKTIRNIVEANHRALSPADRRRIVFRQMMKPKRFRPWADLLAITPWRILPLVLWDLGLHRLHTRSRRGSAAPRS